MFATIHPAVVHFPIALLLLGSVCALLYLYGPRRAELLVLTWAPLFLGWLATGAAILTGLLAQSGLPPNPPYRDVLNQHIGSGMALAVVYAALLYRAYLQRARAASRKAAKKTVMRAERAPKPPELLDDPQARLWVTLLLATGILLVIASGWNGGQLVYEWGVNVR